MIKVKVPATSANIGTGFDCLGLALSLHNTYTFEESDEDKFVGFMDEFANKGNLVYTSMMEGFKQMKIDPPKGITISIDESIPISRGLGSSAACIVGGVLGAAALVGHDLPLQDALTIASSIEGHPDNIAPAIYGGMTVSIMDGERFYSNKTDIHDGVTFYALIPPFRLETKAARAALPKEISLGDAVHNLSRASMLPLILERGQFELLASCLDDKLHQPYRKGLITGYDDIVEKCKKCGSYGTFISGAGPTIMTVVSSNNISFADDINEYFARLENNWRLINLDVDSVGATVEIID